MESLALRLGDARVELETGEIARQADGAVVVRQADTVVLVTAVAARGSAADPGFFPLSVEYREKSAATGRIPANYQRREGRQADHEVLTARLVDRSIRPLFPKGFRAETQVIATVLSAGPEAEPEPLALLGAAAALHLSDIPWKGPLGGIRLVRSGGAFHANPSRELRKDADLELIVSASREGLVMVEGGGAEISEADVLAAFDTAIGWIGAILPELDGWRERLGRPKRTVTPPARDEALLAWVRDRAAPALEDALQTRAKQERGRAVSTAVAKLTEELAAERPERRAEIAEHLVDLQYEIVRRFITHDHVRLDGRGPTDVRPIRGRVSWLPRTHGSALFTRGETQAIVTCTLGGASDELRRETLYGDVRDRFLLHYNFPPFSVGEVRAMRAPGRREIGHGALAQRALEPVIPPDTTFPYTIRLVSDITDSNGSSSMATVCGGTLALMDAGVPVRRPVAGIAMGLVLETDPDRTAATGEPPRLVILSDIMGDEDHLGDMDFKVAGTRDGVTAVQLDNKIGSLPREVLERALDQARHGRLGILEAMSTILDVPRAETNPFAPRVTRLEIRPERIRDVIGPGGSVIQDIQARTSSKIDVRDDGQVTITAADANGARRAERRIRDLTREAEVGRIYRGTVTGIKDFGAFVRIFGATEGLVHISELDTKRVERVTDILAEGDEVIVRVLGVDQGGRIRLSRKAALDADPSEIDDD